jgi:hypothetical protein
MSVKRQEITIPYHGVIEIVMYGGVFYPIDFILKKLNEIGKEKQPMNTKLDRIECYQNGNEKIGYVFAKDVRLSIETIKL